ncbi:MAG TPA: helical backbone metal receptor [Nocardioidaceae bacterium]|nr:helical backbone metal receptor [Nocardioidaceae bacterium]
MAVDDLGFELSPRERRRVVSLVPSLTEAIASTNREALVGATDWCTHPADLDVTRVRGTKNPDLAAIAALEPDLVIVNQEENRELDVRRLRERGVDVWVTRIETVPEAITSMRRLFAEALQWPEPSWLAEAESVWATPAEPRGKVVVPIWRDPWMVVGRDTFIGDLVRRLGYENVYAGAGERYPKVDPTEFDRDDVLVLLPDEPYVFTTDDGPEVFAHARTELVSGRLLTWYGPSLLEARALSW